MYVCMYVMLTVILRLASPPDTLVVEMSKHSTVSPAYYEIPRGLHVFRLLQVFISSCNVIARSLYSVLWTIS
jgi:hypothetical protein